MAVWWIRVKSLWSGTTATSHASGKVWVELTILLKVEPWDTSLTNTTVAALFVKIFGADY